MELWQKVFHEGIVPSLSTPGLVALRDALVSDDPQLIQGCTTLPPPMQCVQDWPVEGACAVSYAGWKGNELETVSEVEQFFAHACFNTDTRLGEPAGCRHFLNWFDETPRDEMLVKLLPEVERALTAREKPC